MANPLTTPCRMCRHTIIWGIVTVALSLMSQDLGASYCLKPAADTGRVADISETSAGVLVGAEKGLWWLVGDKLEPFIGDTGRVREVYDTSAGVLVQTETRGVWRVVGNKLEPFVGDTGPVREVYDTSAGVLVSTERELWRLVGDKLESEPVVRDMRWWSISIKKGASGYVLVSTERELWRLVGDKAELLARDLPKSFPRYTDQVPERYVTFELHETSAGVLVQTENDLWRPVGGELERLSPSSEARPQRSRRPGEERFRIYDTSAGVLVGAEERLWRLTDNKLEPVAEDIGPVRYVLNSPAGVLAWTARGLWRVVGNEFKLLSKNPAGPYITLNSPAGVLVGAEKGLWRLVGDKLEPVAEDMGRFVNARKSPAGTLIWTEKGLWWLVGDKLESIAGDMGDVGDVHDTSAGVLAWTEKGFWRLADNKLESVAGDTGRVHQLYETSAGVLVRAEKGLFYLVHSPLRVAKFQFIYRSGGNFKLHYRYGLSWTLENYPCLELPASTLDKVLAQRVVLKRDGQEVKETPAVWTFPERFEIVLGPFEQKGEYPLQIIATSPSGDELRSDWIPFSVGREWQDVVGTWGPRASAAIVVVHLVAFVMLATGARWSRRCFDLLTDPTLRKLGLYFGVALQYVRPVQLWVFERYFQTVKRSLKVDHPYIPVPITRNDGSVVSSTELLREVCTRSRIWVSGGPGTGKTAMVQAMMQDYFARRSLRKAWQAYGFIPLFVTVRDHPGVTKEGQSWVPEITRAALSGLGMGFRDVEFFYRLLESNAFAVVLDGLNEAQRDDDVRRYANSATSVRLLITSQTSSPEATFTEYRMPRTSRDFTAQLLTAFLGPARGPAVFARLSDGLLSEIRSGYDIQLLADLEAQGAILPADRLGLYQATLDTVGWHTQERYPDEIICKVAWERWLSSERRFYADDRLTEELLQPLQQTKVVVARGKGFEFRHDLMHGYLAARWLVHHAASIQDTVKRLDTEDIWHLSPTQHDLVFPLLVAMITGVDDLQTIAQFAAADPSRRVRLQVATQEVARQKGWSLQVIVGHTP